MTKMEANAYANAESGFTMMLSRHRSRHTWRRRFSAAVLTN